MVHGSQRPRIFTSHSVITGDFFFLDIGGEMLLNVIDHPSQIVLPGQEAGSVGEVRRW
jgi:hypothetical protein